MDFFNEVNPSIIALQEIKLSSGQIDFSIPGYTLYWNYAEKKDILEQQFSQKKKHLMFNMV